MESSEDKLGHIVRCCAEKEFLRLFDLPRPYLDPLGRLAWDGNDEIVSKKYRKVGRFRQYCRRRYTDVRMYRHRFLQLAIYCHADRAGDGVDANKAFEGVAVVQLATLTSLCTELFRQLFRMPETTCSMRRSGR